MTYIFSYAKRYPQIVEPARKRQGQAMTKLCVPSFEGIYPSRFLLRPLILLKHLLTLADEFILNIRTIPLLDDRQQEHVERSLFEDNEEYSTINYWFVRKIIRIVRPTEEDVFYDLGCGMGRVVCMFGRKTLKKCVGVELSPYYYRLCARNAGTLRGRNSQIEVRCQDAATAEISDGTIYYMFNPFGASTMTKVLSNIERSLITNPRRVTIVYANPVYRALFDSCPWLRLYRVYTTALGLNVTFWTNHYPQVGPHGYREGPFHSISALPFRIKRR